MQAPATPQSIGGVLDSGFRLYWACLKETFPIAVAASVLSTAFGRVLQGGLASGGTALFNATLLSLIGLTLLLVLYAAIIARVDAVYDGRTLSLAETLAMAWHRLPAVFGTVLLTSLAVGFGVLLLLVPGIFLTVALAFGIYAAVLERTGPIASIRYSWRLVLGHWWRTAALLTIMLFIVGVLFLIAGILAGVAYAVLIRGAVPEVPVLPWYLDFLVVPLLEGAIMPLLYALALATFRDLKVRSEGGDIAERIAAAQT